MRRVLLVVGGIYLLALGASHLLRHQGPGEPTRPARQFLAVEAVDVIRGDQQQRLPERDQETELRLAYREWSPKASQSTNRVPIVLLHGSPGNADDFATLGPALGEHHRVSNNSPTIFSRRYLRSFDRWSTPLAPKKW